LSQIERIAQKILIVDDNTVVRDVISRTLCLLGQSFEEEIVSHGLALVACLIATPFLLSSALPSGDAWRVLGVAIFAGTIIFMYLSSTLYHLLPENRAKTCASGA